MSIESDIFDKAVPLPSMLAAHGFRQDGNGGFSGSQTFLDGTFRADMTISPDGGVEGKVFDTETGEEYAPVHVEEGRGAFVGAVREAYAALLRGIAETCFVRQRFESPQANRIAALLSGRYGDVPENPFSEDKYDAGVFRNPETGKWYALIMRAPRASFESKCGSVPLPASEERVEILNCKADPASVPSLLKEEGIYPCYHMNKRHWISVVTDGTVPDGRILELLAKSRAMTDRGRRSVPAKKGGRSTPETWIVPANPKYYDIDEEFHKNPVTVWKQGAGILPGDTVYIYCAAPVSAVRYRCLVLESDLPFEGEAPPIRMERLIRIRVEKEYGPGTCPAATLRKLGITAVRGARRVNAGFERFMEGKGAPLS
ncbi:MAG: MmcQ/YjbR family DNA-binding protein [Mailhella sp.]|nr:MmcQ/YjbR family DNA-binding protein [Mailhella sp.]